MVSDSYNEVRTALHPTRMPVRIVVAVALAAALPCLTLVAGCASAKAPTYTVVQTMGHPYDSRDLFDLPAGNGPLGIGMERDADGVPSPTLIVAAPAGNGDVWIADHVPSKTPYGGRLRLFSADGKLKLSFRAPVGATLFTPGIHGDLWMDSPSTTSGNETLLHYDGRGRLVRSYPLPAGMFLRAISVAPSGEVAAFVEEYLVDPVTGNPAYSGALFRAVTPTGAPISNLLANRRVAAFVGANGASYELEGTLGKYETGNPRFHVIIHDTTGKEVGSLFVAKGLRPYAADLRGRIYAEEGSVQNPPVPGHSGLGDSMGQQTVIRIFDPNGHEYARLPVAKPVGFVNWAPSAIPDAHGNVISTVWRDGVLHVMQSSPASDPISSASAMPGPAQAEVIVQDLQPYSGDPYLAGDSAQRDVWQLVYAGLVAHDASLTPVPDLAAEVPRPGAGVAADGLTVTWKLAPGRTWSDGQPVTAADVVATWQYLKRRLPVPGSEPFPGFDRITSVTAAPDGESVSVHLSEKFGPAPECFFPYVLPAHVIAQHPSYTGGIFSAPVGAGPYSLARMERGRWMLEARPGKNAPRIARLDVLFTSTAPGARRLLAETGPRVWTWAPGAIGQKLGSDPGVTLDEVPTGRWYGALLNASQPTLADPRVRSAIATLYPMQAIRRAYGVATGTPVGLFATQRGEAPGGTAPSIASSAAAIALMKAAGYALNKQRVWAKSGHPINVWFETPGYNDNPKADADQRDALTPAYATFNTKIPVIGGTGLFYAPVFYGGQLSRGIVQIGLGVYPGTLDPSWGDVFDPAEKPTLARSYALGVAFARDPELAALAARARQTYDRTERIALAQEISARMGKLHLAIPTFAETRRTISTGITGVRSGPYPAGDFWNARTWGVSGQ